MKLTSVNLLFRINDFWMEQFSSIYLLSNKQLVAGSENGTILLYEINFSLRKWNIKYQKKLCHRYRIYAF